MKKAFSILIVLIILLSTFPALAAGQKTLEVNLNGFGITYQLLMERLHQNPTVKRAWDSKQNTAQVTLTDISFLQIWAQSNKDSSMITEALHVATPVTNEQNVTATCSMVATIFSFDPDLGLEFIVDLVTSILPDKGEYISANCKYEYKASSNVIMLGIEPR